jgi:hypothetical protein
MIVDVLNELDNGKTVDLVAKIVSETAKTFTVQYLSPTKKTHGDLVIYNYESTTYEIDKACVSGYYDSTNEEDAGFIKVDGGWIQAETDSDYQPSEEPASEEVSEEESVVESEED